MAGKISKRYDPSPSSIPDDDLLCSEYWTFVVVVAIILLLEVPGVFS